MTSRHPPVTDWATDFDHTDPQLGRRPVPDLGRPARSAARSPTPTATAARGCRSRHEDVAAVAYDTEHFTSRAVVVSESARPDDLPAPDRRRAADHVRPAVPRHGPPPAAAGVRAQADRALEPFTRELCRELLDADRGPDRASTPPSSTPSTSRSASSRHARLPARGRRPVPALHPTCSRTSTCRRRSAGAGGERRARHVHRRPDRRPPRPPPRRPHHLPPRRRDRRPASCSREHVRGTIVLLLIAGIDTTWSAIGASLWHLAQHPDDRQRLVDDPELMDTAVEEFLRAYAPVTMARLVAKDFDFDGCPMKEDDWVLLPFPAANRDPERVRRPRRGASRPGREPPRRVRARHPPLPRLQPGPHGTAGRPRGVDGPLPGLRARRSRRRHLVRRPGARPAHAPRHHPLIPRPLPRSLILHGCRAHAAPATWARHPCRKTLVPVVPE